MYMTIPPSCLYKDKDRATIRSKVVRLDENQKE